MPKLNLSTITSGYGTVDALNANFDAIETAIDNTLSRNGSAPNTMLANLDMNNNAIVNAASINGAPASIFNNLGDLSVYTTAAAASAASASASATSATNTYDLFDDRYLGSKTSNPTLDNDGNALQVGAEYWNSVSNERRTWTGSAWVASITVVPDNSVTTTKLADGSVTTAKLANGAATLAKLDTTGTSGQVLTAQGAGNAPIWSPPVTVAQLQPISASISANAITVSASALSLDFRSTTLTNGAVTRVSGTPSNLTIASTDSFGLVTAAGNQRIAILAINNAGTIELAASALAGGVALDETGVITTVTAATTGTQIKSATARTNVAYRVIGFVDATFTTATGWGSLTVVQGQGGQALAGMSTLGYGQTWQDLTGSRALGTTYYNTTGKPIVVTAVKTATTGAIFASITVAGVLQEQQYVTNSNFGGATAIVPPGASYSVSSSVGTATLRKWFELR